MTPDEDPPAGSPPLRAPLDVNPSGVRSLALMRVVVGPVSADSAEAWIGFAREVVEDLESLAPGECFATTEVRSIFEGYLAEWAAVAAADEKFVWEQDIPAEQVEYHVHAFHQAATMLAKHEERTGERRSPVEGDEFYLGLLNGVLTSLEAEGPASAAFAQYLGQFWPGRDLSLL